MVRWHGSGQDRSCIEGETIGEQALPLWRKSEMTFKRWTLIFDLDDTLLETQPLYDEAKRRFRKAMGGLGFDGDIALRALEEIDQANVTRMGLTLARFAKSMSETYELLCRREHRQVQPSVREQVESFAWALRDRVPPLMDGAAEVLRQLMPIHHLILYSAGEVDLQMTKLNATGLHHFFGDDHVYIFDMKGDNQMRKILLAEDLNVDTTWMIGNSVASDLNPALRAGLKCIWLNSRSWKYDQAELLPGYVVVIDSLTEIPAILKSSAV